jgi:hypothetical protein
MSDDDSIIWPEIFGVPRRAGYTYTPTDRRARAEMEIGGRYRVLYDTDETVLNCDFVLKYDVLAFFEAFEKHILKQGSVWFRMPILTAGAIEQHIVRFKERPKISEFMNGIAVVSMALDVRERVTWGVAETWLVYAFGLDSFLVVNRLHVVLHVETPGVTILPDDVYGGSHAHSGGTQTTD